MNYEYIVQVVQNDVNSVLDIGAHQGDFTRKLRQYLPFIKYHMVEANEHCSQHLAQVGFVDYDICLLSNESREVSYFMDKSNILSTGNSYYRELTEHFSDANLVEVKKTTTTLDILFPNKSFDLIKIDTQGSELDILKGGQSLVAKAKYLLLECSTEHYNAGAPLFDEINNYVEKIGFRSVADVGSHHHDGRVVQKDVLYAKI